MEYYFLKNYIILVNTQNEHPEFKVKNKYIMAGNQFSHLPNFLKYMCV